MAKKFFHRKKIVLVVHFDSILWLRFKKAMAGYPTSFCTFVSRYLDGVVATLNYCYGKKVSTANVPNMDANMRTPSTSPDALTQAG